MVEKEEKSSWEYHPDNNESQDVSKPSPRSTQSVSWTASEYINHHRGFGWYVSFLLITAALSALTFLITDDYFAAGVMIALGVIVGIFAISKPRQITYTIEGSSLKIGEKFYSFSSFKSFSVIRDGALSSISLTPLKRFMPPLSAYYAPGDEQKIISALSEHLPYEEGQLDAVDRLSRRLRL